VRQTALRVVLSAAAVAGVTLVIELLKPHVPVLSLGVLYLLAVIPVAIFFGPAYGLAVAVASMLAFNFFFLPPLYTLTIQDSRNWFALLVFIVTAVVVSQLAARSRKQAEEAEAALRELQRVTEERERLAEQAVQAEALRRSDAMKTAILRAVSHDLRTPLMAILTSASALSRPDFELGEAERAELLANVRAAAERLDRLVGNLLDLSRLQAGAAVPHEALVAVDDLVIEALEGLPDSDRVEVALPDDSPAVFVDAEQVQRALANLLENALKYSSPPDPVHVRVAVTSSQVLIRVIDRGPGVSAADAERIFSAFQRGPDAAGVRGAGLGLAIAQGFAEANGGRVWVESHTGQGATFVLALPLARVPVSA